LFNKNLQDKESIDSRCHCLSSKHHSHTQILSRQQVAPPGSDLATFLEFNEAEIKEHEQCIAELRLEREKRLREAILPHVGAHSPDMNGLQGSHSPPQTLRLSEESKGVEKTFGDSQGIDCSAYGTTAGVVAALKRGFLLVCFHKGASGRADPGTELAIKLSAPIMTPSAKTSLTGTVEIDGTRAEFEGTLNLAELKGDGHLRVVAAGA